MGKDELLKIAISIVAGMKKILAEEYVPVNIQGAMHSRGEHNWSVLKVQYMRSKYSVMPADEVAMIADISKVAKMVKAFKQGACGELAMYAYNVARNVSGTESQVLMAEGKVDKHAFVLLGVSNKFKEETSISAISKANPEALVIDYWATENGADSKTDGVFTIGEYEEGTEDALDAYDLDKVKTWSYS